MPQFLEIHRREKADRAPPPDGDGLALPGLRNNDFEPRAVDFNYSTGIPGTSGGSHF
jgi:hypothetical protein